MMDVKVIRPAPLTNADFEEVHRVEVHETGALVIFYDEGKINTEIFAPGSWTRVSTMEAES